MFTLSKRDKPDFEKGNGLVPAIIQDHQTRQVLMLGYMDEAAFKKTRKEGRVTFYSRTRDELWTKGETSGNFLIVKEIKFDCDRDTLLIRAEPQGPVCHTGSDTCFGEANLPLLDFIGELQQIIRHRKANPSDSSYTSKLIQQGVNKIAKKLGEEAVEVVIEAKDNDHTLFINECADLLYHFLVLLAVKDSSLEEVAGVLAARNKARK
jgi:phosphoribosyl-ATP pyrophosphohydrolase/phosphoribosyl-AMP cyclohydrolase